MSGMCGGASQAKPANEDVQKLVEQVYNIKKINSNLLYVGLHYFKLIKVQR